MEVLRGVVGRLQPGRCTSSGTPTASGPSATGGGCARSWATRGDASAWEVWERVDPPGLEHQAVPAGYLACRHPAAGTAVLISAGVVTLLYLLPSSGGNGGPPSR